ncbi:MAG: sulfotransferase [Deltaproteobacteria bacterium]|nr:MAG: sulfotransferase [Deltaproteobacteria bacterium]
MGPRPLPFLPGLPVNRHAMVVSSPRRPLGLRLLNRTGRALRAVGLPVLRLDEASLLARASRRTGLDDFGDGAFRESLRRLLDALEHEAALTLLGRLIARADCVRLLENRLRIVHTLRRHPEIERQDIRQPIFIVGLPRTGTTILHELLAQDPANRVPMTWEVMHPWPPPERATYRTDPRIAQVEKHFAGVDRLVPGFKAMHPMGAELPQEYVALTAHDFASMLFSTTHDVPSYDAWLKPGHATGQEP